MTLDELEAHLADARETDALEFKQGMPWDKAALVKDILALSNVADGGLIVIGIEDNPFARKGVSKDDISTYHAETMRDQIATYATPRVEFNVHIIKDQDSLEFVVIEVLPFEDIPIICAKSGSDVKRGEIYFRSRAKRPASARIERSEDMREIIETSISRRLNRLRRIGLVAPVSSGIDYDTELGGL